MKWTTICSLTAGFCMISLIRKCDLAVIINATTVDYSVISTVCQISGETEGYCVPIRNCLGLLNLNLSESTVRERQCGSRNENVKNRKVCCEKYLLQLQKSVSSTPEPSFIFPEESNVNRSVQQEAQPLPPQKFQPLPPQESQPLQPQEGCGIQNIDSRLVGGNPTQKKEFPWLGRLLRKDVFGDLLFSCTGTLISSKVVLTAAHCLVSESLVQSGELYAVVLGERETECTSDINECLMTKKIAIISKHLAHPLYNKSSYNHDNDIGLVFLRDRLQFTSHITPICLLESRVDAAQYFISGWGRTESGNVSNVKLKISIPPFDWDQCAKKYNSIRVQLTERQICAGGVEGVDSCQGDSGGPLMFQQNDMKWYMAGVVSFGLSCGKKGWPGIYLYVPNYITWIRTNMQGNN